MRAFLSALRFLTVLPVPEPSALTDAEWGRTLLFYPLVGLVIGLLLVVLYLILEGMPPAFVAALLLAAWVGMTGGLHLDGLSDSADAWVGGMGDRERTLAIMKDPYCGPAGVVALVLCLLIKFSALQVLISNGEWSALVVAPLLGRTYLPLLFLTTPYVRSSGMGSAISENLHRSATLAVALLFLIAMVFLLKTEGLWLILSTTIVFVLVRLSFIHRIGGTTGDTAGSLVEVVETVVLTTAVII